MSDSFKLKFLLLKKQTNLFLYDVDKKIKKLKNRERNLLEQCNPTPMLPNKTPEGKKEREEQQYHCNTMPHPLLQLKTPEGKKENNNNIIATLCTTLMLQLKTPEGKKEKNNNIFATLLFPTPMLFTTPMLQCKTPDRKRKTAISLQHYAPSPCHPTKPLK